MTDRAVASTRLIGPQSRVGAVPMRLRRFVAFDSDLLLAILTATSTLEILTQRATLISPIGTGIGVDAAPLAALHRLYRSADAADRRVLVTARQLDRADGRN
jgi:hypothetical protein